MIKHFLLFVFLSQLAFVCAHGHSENHDHNSQEKVGEPSNIYAGFGLVTIGAVLGTMGALILYCDNLFRLLPGVSKNYTLSQSKTFLGSTMSFSAGVLLATIFMHFIPESVEGFEESNYFKKDYSKIIAYLSFVGLLLVVVLFKRVFLHSHDRPQTISKVQNLRSNDTEKIIETSTKSSTLEEQISEQNNKKSLRSAGYKVAIALAIHNFPEGILVFASAYNSIQSGAFSAFALGLHKIPEGLMISVPIYYGTGSKKRACLITFMTSFVTQILGALVAYLLLKIYFNQIINGILLVVASSILVHAVFSEILPICKSYDPNDKRTTLWICLGIMVYFVLASFVH